MSSATKIAACKVKKMPGIATARQGIAGAASRYPVLDKAALERDSGDAQALQADPSLELALVCGGWKAWEIAYGSQIFMNKATMPLTQVQPT
jgi:hypothetical protein